MIINNNKPITNSYPQTQTISQQQGAQDATKTQHKHHHHGSKPQGNNTSAQQDIVELGNQNNNQSTIYTNTMYNSAKTYNS